MNRKRSFILSGLIVIAVTLGVLALQPQNEPETAIPQTAHPEPVKSYANIRSFLGTQTIKILEGANRTETFRVDWDRHKKADATFDGWPVRAKGKTQGEDVTQHLASILLDEKTYLFDMDKTCIFMPGVGFRLWNGQESVEVVICFECDQLTINSKDSRGHSIRQVNEDFDPARSPLVKLAKDFFPIDKDIQKLKATS